MLTQMVYFPKHTDINADEAYIQNNGMLKLKSVLKNNLTHRSTC